MDYKEIARQLIDLSGGTANISSVTHCSTRLRFFINDTSKVDIEAIKKIKPVLGVVLQGDELQIVLGKNIAPVYTEASKMYEESGDKASSSPADGLSDTGKTGNNKQSLGSRLIGFVSAAVTPLIPGLVAGGMLKVFLLLGTLVYAPFEETQAYTLLGWLANVPFYFMPIFVAYGASRKLGSTPLYAMTAVGALLYPNFVSLVAEGNPITIFGLPVSLVSYNTTLLPALLISVFAYYCEKLLTKIIPGIIRTVLVGMLTIGISYVVGVTLLGPLGDLIGSYVVHFFIWSSDTFGPVAVGLLATAMPWLVMTGMHHAVTPFMVQAFADPGYDVFFRPSYILHNMAEGGACIGVALRHKNKAYKAECLSLAFGCIVAGVTEPALYGVNLRLKKPMIGIMAGAAAGGVVAGALGATAYVYGYSTILALPIFQDTMLAMAIAIVVDVVVSAAVTFVLGFDDPDHEPDMATAIKRTEVREAVQPEDIKNKVEPAKAKKAVEAGEIIGPAADSQLETALSERANVSEIGNEKSHTISALANGKMFPVEQVKDDVFSQKVLGNGVAFELEDDLVCAPADGVLSLVYPTGHAFGISTQDGVEFLVHIGIDTVKLDGKGFWILKEQGSLVKAGDPVIKVDRDAVKNAGYDLSTILIVTEDAGMNIAFDGYGEKKAGEIITQY